MNIYEVNIAKVGPSPSYFRQWSNFQIFGENFKNACKNAEILVRGMNEADEKNKYEIIDVRATQGFNGEKMCVGWKSKEQINQDQKANQS